MTTDAVYLSPEWLLGGLAQIRDITRSGLMKPDVFTEAQWLRGKLNNISIIVERTLCEYEDAMERKSDR